MTARLDVVGVGVRLIPPFRNLRSPSCRSLSVGRSRVLPSPREYGVQRLLPTVCITIATLQSFLRLGSEPGLKLLCRHRGKLLLFLARAVQLAPGSP